MCKGLTSVVQYDIILVMNDNKIAYLAGILDGEGCVNTYKLKNGRGVAYDTFCVVISNTSRELVDWIITNFGGNVQTMKKKNPEHKTSYNIHWRHTKAKQLYKLLEPYLIIKVNKLD